MKQSTKIFECTMWIIIILLITAPFYFYGHELAHIDESCVVVKVGKEGQRCDISSESLNTAQKAEFGSPECARVTIVLEDSSKQIIDCALAKKVAEAFNYDKKMIAIIFAESQFKTTAINVNKNKSVDRGLLQLNSQYWDFKEGDLSHNLKEGQTCKKELGYDCWWAHRNLSYLNHLEEAGQLLSQI